MTDWWRQYEEKMAIERARKKAERERDEAQMEYADALRDLAQARAEIALWRTAYRNAFDAWTALKQEVQQDVDAKRAKLPSGGD